MDDLTLQRLVARIRALGSDDAHVEAKTSAKGLPKDVWDSVSSFANTNGGVIVLGLDERQGFAPAEGFTSGPIMDAMIAGLSGPEYKVEPVPDHQLDQGFVDGQPVVVLQVEQLRVPGPCFVTSKGVKAGSFRRIGDHDVHLTPYEVYLLQTRDEYTGLDREPVTDASLDDLDPGALGDLIARLERQNSQALVGARTQQQQLRRLNIVDVGNTPTLSGVLSMAHYPQQFFPQLFIDVTVHPGREKGTLGGTRFVDRVLCEGPIPTMVQTAVAAVLRNLRNARVVQGVGGHDVPEIPEDVLREAIVNALMHRDYSPQARGQQVAVDIFTDRVEVTNPGGFWGGVSERTIFDGVSRSRNDTLAKMLANVPLPGGGTVGENQGSGVSRMVTAMRDRGLPIPEFESTIDQVKVTLSRFGLLDQETRSWINSIPGADSLTNHQQIALVLANGPSSVVTPQELRVQLGIDSDDARALLDELRRRGLLDHLGADLYQLAKSPRPDVSTDEAVDAVAALGPSSVTNPLDREILRVIADSELSIQEIATATGHDPKQLRPALKRLVTANYLVPTAPATSRNRRYVRHGES